MAHFRKTFLAEIQDLFVQILLLAQAAHVLRQERLLNLAQAKAVLEARAQERYVAEQADYEVKVREREEKARTSGRKPGGRPPTPPTPGPHDTDQDNFTGADSRITPAPAAGAV